MYSGICADFPVAPANSKQRNNRYRGISRRKVPRRQRGRHIFKSNCSQRRRRQKYSQQKHRVAHAIHDECLLRRIRRRTLVKMKLDQQVAAQPHALPPHKQHCQIRRHHQRQHREHKQIHAAKVAIQPALAVHVPDRIDVDQKSHARHDEKHHHGERINLKRPLRPEAAQPPMRHVCGGNRQPIEKRPARSSDALLAVQSAPQRCPTKIKTPRVRFRSTRTQSRAATAAAPQTASRLPLPVGTAAPATHLSEKMEAPSSLIHSLAATTSAGAFRLRGSSSGSGRTPK